MKFTIKNLLLLTGPFLFISFVMAALYFQSFIPLAILIVVVAIFAGKTLVDDLGDK